MDIEKIIKSKIKERDIFSNPTKLLRYIGFPETKSDNSKKSQLKETERYVEIVKTGKLNKQYNKLTNEIMILTVYDTPLPKNDKRLKEGTQEVIDLLKPILLNMGSFELSYGKIINENIMDIDFVPTNNNNVLYYKNYLFDYLKGKISTSLRQLNKQYGLNYMWEYTYVVQYKDDTMWCTLSEQDIEYIETMKFIIKEKIIAKHNNKLSLNSQKIENWNKIAFRYRNSLYKQLNNDLKGFKGIEKIYKVVIVNTKISNELIDLDNNKYQLKQQIKKIMSDYINDQNRKQVIDNEVLDFHKKIFND